MQKSNKHRRGFTLLEIMIVTAIVALLAVIAIPGYLRSRKRSLATTLLNSLRVIAGAKEQYETENVKNYVTPVCRDLKTYFKPNSSLYNAIASAAVSTSFSDPKIQSVTFYINDSNTLPSIDAAGSFSDIVDNTFWLPFSAN